MTVNAELQKKLEELSQANNDLANLLDSTEIGTLFLDDDLRLKRFTPAISRLINLIPTDVGRPIGDIVTQIVRRRPRRPGPRGAKLADPPRARGGDLDRPLVPPADPPLPHRRQPGRRRGRHLRRHHRDPRGPPPGRGHAHLRRRPPRRRAPPRDPPPARVASSGSTRPSSRSSPPPRGHLGAPLADPAPPSATPPSPPASPPCAPAAHPSPATSSPPRSPPAARGSSASTPRASPSGPRRLREKRSSPSSPEDVTREGGPPVRGVARGAEWGSAFIDPSATTANAPPRSARRSWPRRSTGPGGRRCTRSGSSGCRSRPA